MTSSPVDFAGAYRRVSAVDAYAELLAPRLFEPWAELLLDALRPPAGGRALDVACGVGTVSRALAARLGPQGTVRAADISAAMVETARRWPVAAGAAPIAYVVSPAAPLDAADAVFDVVTCEQGLQFFPDAAAALAEMRRTLRKGGRVALAMWRGIERCAVYAALERSLIAVVGAERAAALRGPFSWPGATAITELLEAGGWADISVAEHARDLVLEGGVGMALRLLEATPFAEDLASLNDEGQRLLTTSAEDQFRPLIDASGAVRGAMVSVIATAAHS